MFSAFGTLIAIRITESTKQFTQRKEGEAMRLKLTKHAEERKRQRGFSKFSLDIIKRFGRYEKAPGNAEKIFFGNKEYQQVIGELKKAIQVMDKAKGGTIIFAGDEILTMYK